MIWQLSRMHVMPVLPKFKSTLLIAIGLLSSCGRTQPPAPVPEDSGSDLQDRNGQILLLTFNVQNPFDGIPTGLAEGFREYRAALERQKRIAPLLNDYDLVLLQESFVARVNGSRRDLLPRFDLAGLYRPLDRAAEHRYRSGYQQPFPAVTPSRSTSTSCFPMDWFDSRNWHSMQ